MTRTRAPAPRVHVHPFLSIAFLRQLREDFADAVDRIPGADAAPKCKGGLTIRTAVKTSSGSQTTPPASTAGAGVTVGAAAARRVSRDGYARSRGEGERTRCRRDGVVSAPHARRAAVAPRRPTRGRAAARGALRALPAALPPRARARPRVPRVRLQRRRGRRLLRVRAGDREGPSE